MDGTPDLTFVAPHRRAEVLRRIGLIERFLAAPGRLHAEACAADLGLTYVQFYRMVKVWRSSGRPEGLPGARSGYDRRTPVTVEQRQLLADAVAADPEPTIARVMRQARAAAVRSGMQLPAQEASRRLVAEMMAERALRTGMLADFDVIVTHAAIDVPVDDGRGVPTMPVATFTIDLRGVRPVVIGLAVEMEAVTAASAAASLLDAFRVGGPPSPSGDEDGPVLRLHLDVGIGEGWNRITEALAASRIERGGRTVALRGRRDYSKAVLGPRPAGLRLHPEMAFRPPAERSASLRAGAVGMPLDEAESLIRSRLVRRPAGAPRLMPSAVLASSLEAMLPRPRADLPPNGGPQVTPSPQTGPASS